MRAKGLWIDQGLLAPPVTFVSVSWYPGYKRKRGERLPVLVATHCPFCGEKYEEQANP